MQAYLKGIAHILQESECTRRNALPTGRGRRGEFMPSTSGHRLPAAVPSARRLAPTAAGTPDLAIKRRENLKSSERSFNAVCALRSVIGVSTR